MKILDYAELDSPVGRFLVACTDTAVCALDYDGYQTRLHSLLKRNHGDCELRPAAANPLGIADALRRYFGGAVDAFDGISTDTGGTEFQQTVWRTLRGITAGERWTYGELARAIGRPEAARAVGHANSLNPVAIIIPCHRVIGANGKLTGYAGGLERKRWLLEHERRTGQADLFAAL